jgi:hypothetical protein
MSRKTLIACPFERQLAKLDAAVGRARGAEKAFETLDATRRVMALETDPEFPEDWGPFTAKYFATYGAEGESVHPIRPGGKYLTIWRFADREATAVFKTPRYNWGVGIGWDHGAPPCSGGWEFYGSTSLKSTLYVRVPPRSAAPKGGAQ